MRREIFRMERVTYREQEVTQLRDFNIQIDQGEIMGLLPVNSHGLAAFLKLLETNLPLHDGYVYYGGELVNSWKGSARTQNRISVIGAANRLVDALSVTDNIFVMRQGFRQEIIRKELLWNQLQPFLKDIDMDLPADVPVKKLPVFERVVLELLRAVVLGHRLIVLHEIGTLISYEELSKLHRILRHYAAQGFSFLYICPHFEELEQICSRSALLSHGRILKTIPGGEMADQMLKLYTAEYESMVRYHLEKREAQYDRGHKVLEMSHLAGKAVNDFSLEVYEGECVAVQIMDNDSFLELRELLMGEESPRSGKILVDGKRQRLAGNPKVAVIRELPTRTMLFPQLSYMENLCICLAQRIPSFWGRRNIQKSVRLEYGPILGEEIFQCPVEELSERQKYQLVYTRILLAKPRVVFCVQPFKGADLPHRMFIWKMLEMLLSQGIAVVLLSLALSDSLALADRLVILGKEEQREILRKDFASVPEIVPWMYLYRERERQAEKTQE